MLKALEDSHVKTDYVSVLEGSQYRTAHIILAEGDNSIIVIKVPMRR
jgi:hypothetical protein